MDGDGQDLLGPLLADDVLVQLVLDGAGRGDVGEEGLGGAAAALLLVDDRLAQLDAFAADVDIARPLDQGTDVAVALTAKGTVGIAIAPAVARRPPPAGPCAGVFVAHAFSLCART